MISVRPKKNINIYNKKSRQSASRRRQAHRPGQLTAESTVNSVVGRVAPIYIMAVTILKRHKFFLFGSGTIQGDLGLFWSTLHLWQELIRMSIPHSLWSISRWESPLPMILGYCFLQVLNWYYRIDVLCVYVSLIFVDVVELLERS